MSDIPMRFCESYYTDPVESVDEADSTIVEEEVFEECDWFICLGESLFYVSEYHNALFDDPDAHDEAVNEFGILLDSYDDDVIQEASAQKKPYDAYLKKLKYDPKNNTVEDPNRPGKRISAGKTGSAKERNRMNKFLRENDYDPKTDTIQTDINDPKNKGSKKRLKFAMNPNPKGTAAKVEPKSMATRAISKSEDLKNLEAAKNARVVADLEKCVPLNAFERPDCPKVTDSDIKWAEFLAKYSKNPSLFKDFPKKCDISDRYSMIVTKFWGIDDNDPRKKKLDDQLKKLEQQFSPQDMMKAQQIIRHCVSYCKSKG